MSRRLKHDSYKFLLTLTIVLGMALLFNTVRNGVFRSSTSRKAQFPPLLSKVRPLRQEIGRVEQIRYQSVSSFTVIGKNELREQLERKEIILYDVREPDEIAATGPIQTESTTAINFPLGFIESGAFEEDADRFEDNYGFKKPDVGEKIAFSCRSGVRSTVASNAALKAGYENVYNYKGSALEWFS